MASVPLRPLASAVIRAPSVWGEALRAVPAMARRGWWRRRPFLPVPDDDYLRWRVTTAYGDPGGPVAPEDIVAFLEWRKRQRRS